jgi:hypothetical protein
MGDQGGILCYALIKSANQQIRKIKYRIRYTNMPKIKVRDIEMFYEI